VPTPRPCLASHPDPAATAAGCRLCLLFQTDARYRELWGGDPAGLVNGYRLSLPCVHLGPATGQSRPKLHCAATPPVQVETFACALHGTCTRTTPARETDCCRYCADKELPPEPTGEEIVVDHGAGGIGDGLLGLLAVARLKEDHPDRRVVYRVSATALPFVALFRGYDVLGRSAQSHSEAPVEGARQLNVGYRAENQRRYPAPRWERYAANAGTRGFKVPPLADPHAANAAGADLAGAVVLCPFSTDRMREWSLHHWLTLEAMLTRAGYRPVIVHDRPTPEFRSLQLVAEPAERIAGVMLRAKAVIGSDSGMAHLGAILGVPTIVLGGSTPVARIFGAYPRVACIQGGLDCSGCCGGTGVVPLPDRCHASCSNLQSITPARVLEEVDRLWLKLGLAADRSLIWHDRLASIRDQVLATNHLAGDVAELGVYLGGTAKIIGHYAAGAALHLFDTFAGLPADDQAEGGHHVQGEFRGDLDDVQRFLDDPNAVFHAGEFPATAPPGEGLRFRFVHVDADTYQSTKAALEYFSPRIVPGGVMLFDDFGWWACPGVGKAIHEAGLRPEEPARYQGLVRF
jgi:hypothetical protein